MSFPDFASRCPHRIEIPLHRRPVNGLNVETGKALPRCKLLPPIEWGDRARSVIRWLLSGGSPLVLGHCSIHGCGLGHRWCASCGHREESHGIGTTPCTVGCECEHFQEIRRGANR